MANTLKLRGGTTAEVAAASLAEREIMVDTTKDVIVVGPTKKEMAVGNGGTLTGNYIFSNDVTVNGATTFGTSINANSLRIQNVATPTGNSDATSKSYVDAQITSAVNNVLPGNVFSAGSTITIVDNNPGTGDIDISLADNAVSTAKIADNAVTSAKFADGSITGNKLLDGGVATSKLASQAVTTDKLAVAAVTESRIANGAVGTTKLADGQVTVIKLATDCVTSDKIQADAVVTAKIADNAITTALIANSNVTTEKINDAAVTTDKINDGDVTTAKLANGAVTAAKLDSGVLAPHAAQVIACANSATAASNSETAAANSASASASSAGSAATSATNAANSESAASTHASAASASASTATTIANQSAASATNAASSATQASTSSTSASTSATAAASSAAAALAAFDNFDDTYLGAKASDPTVDNDGDALNAGDLYFNSTTDVMRLYTGSAWVSAYVPGVAADIVSTAVGTVTATNVQAAIAQLEAQSSSLVSETAPQLGANLDGNGNSIFNISNLTLTGTVDGRDVAADGTKLDGIESGATGDQTASEIRALVQSASDSNVFTDADHTKLNGIATGAEVNVNADWNSSSGDSQILNKPTIPAAYTNSSVDSHLNTSTASNGELLSWNGSDYDWTTPAAGYADSNVDTHLNRSTASTGEILSWNGSDYDWVAQPDGGGGAATVDTTSLNTNFAINPDSGTMLIDQITANRTYTDDMASGESVTMMVSRSSLNYSITWPTIKWVGGSQPILPAGSVAYAIITVWKAGTTLFGSYGGDAS